MEDPYSFLNGYKDLELFPKPQQVNLKEIEIYLAEALTRLVKSEDPLKSVHDFLLRVLENRHLDSSTRFSFSVATLKNRKCLASRLYFSLGPFFQDQDFKYREFDQMLRLECNDIPSELTKTAWCVVVTNSDNIDTDQSVNCSDCFLFLLHWIVFETLTRSLCSKGESIWEEFEYRDHIQDDYDIPLSYLRSAAESSVTLAQFFKKLFCTNNLILLGFK